MVKAGLEFAQAAADSQVARKNGDQKNTLLSDDGQSGSGASSQASVRDQIRNPQLEKLLQEKGVSPDSFMDRLASGGIGDTQEMLKALGETDSVSAEDLAQAESQANNQFGSVLSDVYARPEFKSLQGSLRVGFDDKADVNPNLGSSGGNSGSGGIRTSSGSRDVHGEGAASPSASTDSVVIWDKDSGEVNQKSSDSLAASREFEGDPSSFIRSYFGIGANGAQTGKEAWQNTGISRERLAAIGISKQSVWQSIFQIGHRNYRGYRKWRGGLKSKTTIKSSRNLASVEKSLDSRQGN
jgi:hypothetical protein